VPCVHGSAVHIGRPGRQSDFLGRHEADDHPGQGLEKPPIYGVLMSAQGLPILVDAASLEPHTHANFSCLVVSEAITGAIDASCRAIGPALQ